VGTEASGGRSTTLGNRSADVAGSESELRGEQETVDRLYRRLDQLRAQTRARLAEVRREGPSGSPQNRSERDAFATLYEDRVAQLEAVEDRLAFGRLDLTDGAARYVGRIGLADEDHASILTDWRAPAVRSSRPKARRSSTASS
jgi:DNA helicase IV